MERMLNEFDRLCDDVIVEICMFFSHSKDYMALRHTHKNNYECMSSNLRAADNVTFVCHILQLPINPQLYVRKYQTRYYSDNWDRISRLFPNVIKLSCRTLILHDPDFGDYDSLSLCVVLRNTKTLRYISIVSCLSLGTIATMAGAIHTNKSIYGLELRCRFEDEKLLRDIISKEPRINRTMDLNDFD